MRIATSVMLDMNRPIGNGRFVEVSRQEFEYSGPLALCGGGPDPRQTQAADRQAAISQQEADLAKQQYADQKARLDAATPFYTGMMTNGLSYTPAALDYSGGLVEKSIAPARAALIRSFGASTGLPSGFRTQALSDLETNKARMFDDNLMRILAEDQAAKERGASGVMGVAQTYNPASYFSGAQSGNTSILNADSLRKPGFAGVLGAIIGGGSNVLSKYVGNKRSSPYGDYSQPMYSTNLFPNGYT